MNRSDKVRIFVLDAPRGGPHELPPAEAFARAGMAPGLQAAGAGVLPLLTAALRQRGAAAVVVTQTAAADGRSRHWLDAEHARGWIAPTIGQDIDSLLPAWQAQLAHGHVAADAALMAWPTLPRLSWGDDQPASDHAATASHTDTAAAFGLYAIADSVNALRRVLEAGVRTVQLRVKRPADADPAWDAALRSAVRDGFSIANDHGALLFINDHWRLAADSDASAVHLGQEDLLALGEGGRAELRASGLALGVSSHAVWELCRARSLAPRYIACGPVWPTTTKAMPWHPQGLDNLAWWCRVAGAPVVAIGGILMPEQVRQAAACGASGVCVLRGLGSDPRLTVAALQQAFEQGLQDASAQADWPVRPPHPTLGSPA